MADVCVGRKQNMTENTAFSTEYYQLHHTCDLKKATVHTVELILLNIAEDN